MVFAMEPSSKIRRIRQVIIDLLGLVGWVPPGYWRCRKCGYTARQEIVEREMRERYNSPKVAYTVYCPKCGVHQGPRFVRPST
jgi:hypothetical protein